MMMGDESDDDDDDNDENAKSTSSRAQKDSDSGITWGMCKYKKYVNLLYLILKDKMKNYF